MRRRRLIIAALVLAFLLALVLAALVRKAAPPEAARLLPGAQGFVYLNVKPLRRAKLLDQLPPVALDTDYGEFVRQTGFDFERDLDEAAFAIHAPAEAAPGSSQRLSAENRYTEIFVGRFDAQRLARYLRKLSGSVDVYRNRDIINIPHEGRVVRVCFLGPAMVAVSNVDDPAVIRGVVNRYHKLASPFGGPSLLRHYYRRVPFVSPAWAILDLGAVAPASGNAGAPSSAGVVVLPGGYQISFPPGTVMVGSVRYLGEVDLKIRAFTAGEHEARGVADQMSAFLELLRTLEANAGGDADVRAFFESIHVEQDQSTAVLTANLPPGIFKKILTEPPSATLPQAPAQPEKKPRKHR